MRAVLDFARTYWVVLLSGVISLGCVVLAFVAMSSTSIENKMEGTLREIGAGDIRRLRSAPKNDAVIEAEKQRVEAFKREYEQTIQTARQINQHEPLMDGVFPTVTDDANPLRFVAVYTKELQQIPRKMRGGTLPTPAEIAEEQQNVDDLKALEQEQAEEELVEEDQRPGGGRQPPAPGRGLRPPTGGRTAVGRSPYPPVAGGRGLMPPGQSRGLYPPRMGPTGMTPQTETPTYRSSTEEPKYDPVFRAQVSKALSIQCYVEQPLPEIGLSPSFHVSPIVTATANPTPQDLWYAQVGLWINEDVAKTIRELNAAAAQRVGAETANVGHMPVKRLISTNVFGYVLADGTLWPFPSYVQTSTGQQAAPVSFTKRKANSLYDVVQFRLAAVVDQQEMLKLIDQLSKTDFYQCIGASYEAVDRQAEEALGYFYGPEPVVRVTLDFEGYLLREVYKPLMPKPVKELLGIKDEQG